MDSSQLVGGAEECSSSESGWTMYLASPMHGQAQIEDEGETSEDDDGDHGGASGGGEDGDSLASDASSGPPHRSISFKDGSLGGNPIPNQVGSEEEQDDDGHRMERYTCRKSRKSKEKKCDNGGASVSRIVEGGGTVSFTSEKLTRK